MKLSCRTIKRLMTLSLSTIIALSLCSCSLRNLKIEKLEKMSENGEVNSEFVNGVDVVFEQKEASMGEKIYPTSIYSPLQENVRGEIYVTVNKVEVFDSLGDAGINMDEVYLPAETLNVEYCYDPEADKLFNNNVIVKVQLTVENVNASVVETVQDDRCGEYCFSARTLGFCGLQSWNFYFDGHGKYGDDVDDDMQYFSMDLAPGETKDIVMAYVVDLNGEGLENVRFMTQMQGVATNIDLNLDEIWKEE